MKEQIKQAIEKDIAEDLEGIKFYEKVVRALIPAEGRVVTKRMATAIEKMFPGHVVYYNTELSWHGVEIWKTSSDDRKRFVLAYKSDPVFSLEDFAKFNACYGSAAAERIEKNKKYLKAANLAKLVSAAENLRKAKAEWEKFESYDFPALYAIERVTGERV